MSIPFLVQYLKRLSRKSLLPTLLERRFKQEAINFPKLRYKQPEQLFALNSD